MRFDMRAPATGAPIADLYRCALEMAEWGEGRGCAYLFVSEHHASPDGYLPAPLILASALAARTRTTPIQVAALLVPLHDPVDLAEQMAVLDIVSQGRVSYVCAVGYRSDEYAMFGHEMKERGRRMELCLDTIRRAWSGESFDFEGRVVTLTPQPTTPGGPLLLMGGGSRVVVRRAAKFGMGMIAEGGDSDLSEIYHAACDEFGTTPGPFFNPPRDLPTSIFVADDIDEGWDELGSYLLHDARMYGEWSGEVERASGSRQQSVEDLRTEEGNYRVLSVEQAVERAKAGILLLQPLCGGLPPELAWKYLRRVTDEVVPSLGA
jgi:alkanesulfonate monooxygenase SsuD/methylene tetrahydromethanopterin reductase-like flavin-dependent oxidoreductase (luciferase family)